jgi:hypothetical protein
VARRDPGLGAEAVAALRAIDRQNAWADISMSVAYVRRLLAAADDRAAKLAARVCDLERVVQQLTRGR